MKFLGQTRDGVIDNLLRAYVSRPSNPHQACPDFDPDRANAYIEQALTGASRLHYEKHLSECAACRKSVVALVRLAGADTVAHLSPAREVVRSTWLTRVKQALGAISQPQWAMAAAAVIVFAVSLPLILSRNEGRDAAQMVAEQPAGDRPVSAAAPASPGADPRSGETRGSLASTSKPREKSDAENESPARNAPAPSTAPESAAGIVAADALSKKTETASSAQPVDDQRKPDGQSSQPPAQAGAAPGSQVGKNDSEGNRQQQSDKDAAQRVNEPKLAARVDEERAKEKTERAEDVAAPPSPSSEAARERSGFRRSGRLSLRDSATGDAVRPEERRFSGKKFLFRDGAWTDKDFDPNKDLPVVTIIRDSNVYKEVLTKRPGLKPFLTGFPAAERAIIVYKGTVYKLIPQ